MTLRRPTARLAAVLLVLALVAAACGDDGGGGEATEDTAVPSPTDSSTTTVPAADSAEGAQSAGAGLRADLTSLLQEHVYLTGITAEQMIDDAGDPDAPGTQQAIATLDQNSVDLSEVIGSVYGVDAGERFLELWQTHVDSLVDYTVAQAEGDVAAATSAQEDLEGDREEVGDFLESANEELTADGIADEFQPHVDTVLTAIDSFAADDPEAWTELRTAAQVMPDIAFTLAEAIAAQQGLEGDVDSPGAELRADLTSLLQEHVYLAGATVAQVVEDDGDVEAPGAAAAVEALDENSEALAEVMAALYGEAAGQQFLALWRAHIDYYVDYALATAAGDADGAAEALENLELYREDFGRFLESANDLLTKEAVAAELQPHVDSFLLAVDAIVAEDAERFDLLRDAAQLMTVTALTLATNLQIDA
jgi:hypothetical protein